MEMKTWVIKKDAQNVLHNFESVVIFRFKLKTFAKITGNMIHQDLMNAENKV